MDRTTVSTPLSRARTSRRRPGARGRFARRLVAGFAVVAIALTGQIVVATPQPAFAADYPTWQEVQAAKADTAAGAAAVKQITALMEIAVKENDYLAQSFLQWFIDEQLEEVVKMDRLLGVIKQSGERNLLMVEAYLVHIEKASD